MDWTDYPIYDPFTSQAPNIKYHGLANQGATCYLNSGLQVLFMTKDFREAVKRHTDEYADTDFIDHHLAVLFSSLQECTACTYNIMNMLGIDRVYEQRDAAEYFEKILRLTSPEASQIFHGQLTHKTTCSKGHTETDAGGPFWHLPLALVDSCGEDYSVVDSIKDFFKDSVFSGENQMYCDICEARVDATNKCEIKHHPDVLMLLLKRFEFSYRSMSYVKINCVVDVPYTLQIPERQTYELYAFVEHSGDLRGGHYTATIKCQDESEDRWYKFDDSRVTLLDHQVDNSQKSQTAYLLFYRKQKNADTQQSNGGLPSATSSYLDQGQDAENFRERDKGEDAVEAGNDTAVAVSIDRNEETGTEDAVSVVSRGEGPSPDHCYTVEDTDNDIYVRQTEPYNHQECNEERDDMQDYVQDARADEQERDEGKRMRADEEVIQGKAEEAEADDQAENRGLLCKETQIKESVKDPENAGLDFKLEVSDRPAEYGQLNKQNEVRNAQRRIMDVKTVDDKQTAAESLAEYLNRHEDHWDYKGLGKVRQNTSEYQGGKQNIGKDYGLKPGSDDKEGDDKRVEMDVKDDTERKIGADKLTSRKGRLLTKYDLCRPDFHEVVGGKIPKDDGRYKQVCSSRFYKGQGEEKEKEKGVKVDNDRDVRETISVRTHVGVEKQTKVHENEGDAEQIQMRENSYGRRAASERRERLTEDWGAGSDEMTRQGSSQPKARTGFQEVVEGDCGSKQSRIIVKDVKEIPNCSSKRWNETKNIRMKAVEYKVSAAIRYRKKKRVRKNKLWHNLATLKLLKKKKTKQKKTTGFFHFPWKSRKNANQDSELD